MTYRIPKSAINFETANRTEPGNLVNDAEMDLGGRYMDADTEYALPNSEKKLL
jgi:hypothetical protein